MKKLYRYLLFAVLGGFLAFTGCENTAIGDILTLTATVETGPGNSLEEVEDSAVLYSGYNIRVSGGHGRARLTLVSGTVIIELYDATDSSASSTSVSGSQAAMAYLSQGGLTATVNEGSTCTVNVPNGGTFYILGTEAFVIYNPKTEFATVGNFHGEVNWETNKVSGQPLEPGTMVDIGPGGVPFPPYPLPFGPEEFDRIVTEVGSPIETMTILRDMYGIPQPGQLPTESQGQPLFVYEGENMRPVLASDWTVDGTIDSGKEVWTFYLREGVRLENGEPLTAPFAVKYIMEKASPKALRGVEMFPADDLTLVIEFFQGSDKSLLNELPFILFNIQQ